MCAEDVRGDEDIGVGDGTIDMRLGGEMHHRVDVFLAQEFFHARPVANVTDHESEARLRLAAVEVSPVPGVGERVQHHHAITRVGGEPVLGEMRTDEARTAGDEQSTHA